MFETLTFHYCVSTCTRVNGKHSERLYEDNEEKVYIMARAGIILLALARKLPLEEPQHAQLFDNTLFPPTLLQRS